MVHATATPPPPSTPHPPRRRRSPPSGLTMAASATSQNRCVFVGNIPYDATEEQLVQICEEVGPVVSFRLVLDKETGKPKGYGFCEYKDEETALSARRNLQGYEINGRQLRVDFAENGKNADRNREQGRGGPGMASNFDAQKQLNGTSILGDSSLHQPIGLQLATTAASLMAGALGGPQSATVQNGLPVQFGTGNDPATHYLARMSRHQLYEIMSEMKSLTTQNKEGAKQLLQTFPQLPKALFQAEIMLGMVTPPMMQMAKNQNPASSFPQSSSHLTQTFSRPEAIVPMLPRPPVSLASNIPQNQMVLQESTLPLQHVPPYQHPSQSQAKIFPHGQTLNTSGVLTYPTVQSQPLGVPPIQPSQALPTSRGLMPQMQQPFLLQQPRPFGATSSQQPLLPHPHLPQASLINGPLLMGGSEALLKEVSTATAIGLDSSWSSRVNTQGPDVRLPGQAGVPTHLPELSHPSKLRKLEDGSSIPGMTNSNPAIYSGSSQAVVSGGASGSQTVSTVPVQQPENGVSQLTPEVESALLQQVLRLTPEQLSSLSVEQQQQVIQLQKMLSANK